jgi:LmbE family N-acetylglucosaminyl deacetylase
MSRTVTKEIVEREHSLSGEHLSLLAVFAHPEDEAFGPAGMLAKYATEGVQVSLVTALRERAVPMDIVLTVASETGQRDVTCSCRTTGVRRICLMEQKPIQLDLNDLPAVEERLVRVIREIRPQVVVTYGNDGLSGDPDHIRISEMTTRAFLRAGDESAFVGHMREGLTPYAAQKLYYVVMPSSLLQRWGVKGITGVPDEQITTVLDVTLFAESKLKALYCQRNHILDYARWLSEDKRAELNSEYFLLARSNLGRKPRRESDLFFGLR